MRMPESYGQTVALVRLAVERVASGPTDDQRYLELIFALDRAVERNLRYRELLALFEEGALQAPVRVAWAWRLAAGLGANLMGDTAAAIRWLAQAAEEQARHGLTGTAAGAFVQGELARAYYHLGDHAAGIETANRALQLARAANSLQAEAYAHHYLGLLSIRRRDYAYARRHIIAARDLFQRMNQRQGRARVLDSLASLEMELGRYEPARHLLLESLEVKEELRDLRGQALTCGSLARIHTALGDYREAMHYLAREWELVSRVGDERNAVMVRVQLGTLHLRYGSPARAREELVSARALAQARGYARLEAYACFALAEAECQLGNQEPAREAIGRACTYFDGGDDAVMRDRAALRAALLAGGELDAAEVQGPLDRLRSANAPSEAAEALFETALFAQKHNSPSRVTTLYAEALDQAEPAQASQLAARLRARAQTPEGEAWVDAMLTVKKQKDRLEEAYAELRGAQALRDSLTQMIVHDLKNPLTAITPWLQTLQEGGLTEAEEREYLQTAIDECDYLLRMIEDLNDVGKMQHEGTVELEREPVDIRSMLASLAERLQPRAAEVGMRIRVLPGSAGEGEWPPLHADRGRVRRVLHNLIANAIKYGRPPEESGRSPEILLAAVPEPGSPETGPGSVRIEVRDFGDGIPLAEADRVFEPYYQAEAGRRRKAGVGLGLAFCRMVVDAHGGTIWTEPNPGGGSIFAFRLPAPEPCSP